MVTSACRWETLPSDVCDGAIYLHHSLARRLILRFGGYESATEVRCTTHRQRAAASFKFAWLAYLSSSSHLNHRSQPPSRLTPLPPPVPATHRATRSSSPSTRRTTRCASAPPSSRSCCWWRGRRSCCSWRAAAPCGCARGAHRPRAWRVGEANRPRMGEYSQAW